MTIPIVGGGGIVGLGILGGYVLSRRKSKGNV